MNSGVDEVEEEEEEEGWLFDLLRGEGGREEVVWGINDARRQKGGARGGYLGEFLEVHLKKYFGIFLFFAIEKCCFNEKKGVFPWFFKI